MGALLVAIAVFTVTLAIGIFVEVARGFAPAPSNEPSYFWQIVGTGTVISLLIAATHWLPRIGW